MAALVRTRAAHDEREHEQQKCLCGGRNQASEEEQWRQPANWIMVSENNLRVVPPPLLQVNNAAPIINMLK